MSRIVIIGGGIAGLSIAHALQTRKARERGVHVTVLERSCRLGGNIRTETIEGYRCEWGANGFRDNAPKTLALIRDLGLDPDIQPADAGVNRRFIFRRGRLHEVPMGPAGFATSRLLSWRGKLRVALEPWARPRPDGDETIHAFATRRIGREAADILIDPMVSGVFGGDARRLSLQACFPRMWELETQYGGLFRALLALRHERRATRGEGIGAPTGRLTSFRGGTQQLIDALASALGKGVETNAEAVGIERAGARYTIRLADGRSTDAESVVLATTSSVAARAMAPLDAPLAATLSSIPPAPIVVVCVGCSESQLPSPLDGFGFLVPRGEGPRLLGVVWDSSIYPGRAPAGKVLMRAMLGGAHDPQAIELDDAAVWAAVRTDLRLTMGAEFEPEFLRIFRHPIGIPQYTPGHLARLAEAEARLSALPGLFLAGNSYRGVAINTCVAEADDIAARALESVARAA